MEIKRRVRRTKHDFPRLLNVMLCDRHFDEFKKYRRYIKHPDDVTPKRRAFVDGYWTRVMSRYVTTTPNEQYDQCRFLHHPVFIKAGFNPGIAKRQVANEDVLRKLFDHVYKKFLTASCMEKLNKPYQDDFWYYCNGQAHVMYIKMWGENKPQFMISMEPGSMPKSMRLCTYIPKTPDHPFKRLKTDLVISSLNDLLLYLDQWCEEKDKLKDQSLNSKEEDAWYIEMFSGYNEFIHQSLESDFSRILDAFKHVCENYFPGYDPIDLLDLDEKRLLISFENNPCHTLFKHVKAVQKVEKYIEDSKLEAATIMLHNQGSTAANA
jgi:hypothetical protein